MLERNGSLASDYGRLKTPTVTGGGYLDIYQKFAPHFLTYAPAPSMGILGPWHHSPTWPGRVLDWATLRLR